MVTPGAATAKAELNSDISKILFADRASPMGKG